jgi:hypothetical protein
MTGSRSGSRASEQLFALLNQGSNGEPDYGAILRYFLLLAILRTVWRKEKQSAILHQRKMSSSSSKFKREGRSDALSEHGPSHGSRRASSAIEGKKGGMFLAKKGMRKESLAKACFRPLAMLY